MLDHLPTLVADFAALDFALRAEADSGLRTLYVPASRVTVLPPPGGNELTSEAVSGGAPSLFRERWGAQLVAEVGAGWELSFPLVWNMECGVGQVRGFTDEAITFATALEGRVDLRLEIQEPWRCEEDVLRHLPRATRDAIRRMYKRPKSRKDAVLIVHRDPGRYEYFVTGRNSASPFGGMGAYGGDDYATDYGGLGSYDSYNGFGSYGGADRYDSYDDEGGDGPYESDHPYAIQYSYADFDSVRGDSAPGALTNVEDAQRSDELGGEVESDVFGVPTPFEPPDASQQTEPRGNAPASSLVDTTVTEANAQDLSSVEASEEGTVDGKSDFDLPTEMLDPSGEEATTGWTAADEDEWAGQRPSARPDNGPWRRGLGEAAPRHRPLLVVGRSMFETDGIPEHWPAKCNKWVDEVWLPSEFNRRTFAEHGVEASRLRVMPQPIDLRVFDASLQERMALPHAAGFSFLSVFKWEERKGWDVLLAAYLAEFTAADDVALFLRVSADDGNKHELATFLSQRLCVAAGAAEPVKPARWQVGTADASTERVSAPELTGEDGGGADGSPVTTEAPPMQDQPLRVVPLTDPPDPPVSGPDVPVRDTATAAAATAAAPMADELPAMPETASHALFPVSCSLLGDAWRQMPPVVLLDEAVPQARSFPRTACDPLQTGAVTACRMRCWRPLPHFALPISATRLALAMLAGEAPLAVQGCRRVRAAHARGGVGTTCHRGDGDGPSHDRDQLVRQRCFPLARPLVPPPVRARCGAGAGPPLGRAFQRRAAAADAARCDVATGGEREGRGGGEVCARAILAGGGGRLARGGAGGAGSGAAR